MTTQTTDSVFAGLKVVEIASFIAAPAAATMLSDFGADVIKVEPPGLGDPQRLLSSVPTEPGRAGKLQLALGQPQQARHVRRPEVGGRHGDPQASRRMGRRGDHQLPARHPRGPAPGLRGGVGLEPAGHLCRHHRVRRCRTGRQAARVRPDRLLVAQRAARLDPRRGCTADVTPLGQRRLHHRYCDLRRDHDRAVPPRTHGAGRQCRHVAAGHRGVGDRNTGVGGPGRRQAVRAA